MKRQLMPLTRLKYVFTLALAGFNIGTNLCADVQDNLKINLTPSAQRIADNLEGMGYVDVSIAGCWIEFARNIEPKEGNGWTHRYERFVNLDHLAEYSSAIVETVETSRGNIALLQTHMDHNFYEFQRIQFRFKNDINTRYPDVDWPRVLHVENQKYIPEIETAFLKLYENIEHLSRSTSYRQSGSITRLEDWFTLSWSQERTLNEFHSATMAYAQENACDVDN